ncbi:nucleotide exchange factor GrpE [Streptomyces sp. HC44]|uniref:Nucleotide exchange factor GrpE n=1 Tax=Streptomyces scabichelini TaxID=2711217 RepID=A0A6G4UZ66_9ACTN|nr:nucleotide exchange factor GrpE [Streptomyces scabichelini]NGO07078.1 nucleotide exchange factor GrpE [Streptomyces scabichelini]
MSTIMARATQALRRLLPGNADQTLRLRRELREARLEIAERDKTVERLRAELTRAREGAEEGARQRTRADLEQLVTTIGSPLVQLSTQAHLHRSGSAQVRTADVVEVGTRLLRLLRDVGVDTIGEAGAPQPFDPNRHEPLSAATTPAPGEQVLIRVVGLSLDGRTIRKAGVERPEGARGTARPATTNPHPENNPPVDETHKKEVR